MKYMNPPPIFQDTSVFKFLSIFLIAFCGLAPVHADSEVLILIDATDQALVSALHESGAPVYFHSDQYILAGVAQDQLPVFTGPSVRVLDRNPWSNGTLYYWVTRPGSKTLDLTPFKNIQILFQAHGLALVKAKPETAEQLPRQGYEIARITRTPKPYGKIMEPSVRSFGTRDFGGVIDQMVAAINEYDYTQTIQRLEDFVTRYTYTSNINDAADWIYSTFQNFDLEVERHYFPISSYTRQNIIATKTGATYPDEVVFIIAHYDSTSNDPYNNAPGADDNASGTSAVIEAARVLSNYNFERTIKFACFAGEEQGLVGSFDYAGDIYNAGMNVVACINFDMIAWPGSDPAPPDLYILTNSASTSTANLLRDAVLHYLPSDLEPIVRQSSSSGSDHASFWHYGYPAIFGIEDIGSDWNPYYHTTNDTVAHCDPGYATNVTKAGVAALANLAVPIGISETFLVAGPGPAQPNPPMIRVFPPYQNSMQQYEFSAYETPHYGVNLTCGDVTGNNTDMLITGPGPGRALGPHVRGFEIDGTPLPGLGFIAYGTRNYGVNVAAADIDNDGYDEIITGPGPGGVFGPHVRAFNYDGAGSVTNVGGVNFMAYGTRRWGANVSGGDIDADGFDEIVTGAGPGPIFGPHVRGWNIDGGPATAIPAVNFLAYGTKRNGLRVSCGDLDGDGAEEIVTAPGPSWHFGAHIRGWNYDGTSITELPGCSFFAWSSEQARYGARVYAGTDLDAAGRDDLIVGAGQDPNVASLIKVYRYSGGDVHIWFSLQAFPTAWRQGVNVAGGRL